MRGLRINIPTKFFGLNKSDVDAYFDNLTNKHSKELSDLSEEIEKLYKEKTKLLKELQDSKKEDVVYEDEVVGEPKVSRELMDDALKRIEKTIALINMLADEEANNLMEKAYDKIVEYDKIADKLHGEIEENKEKIELLLSDVVKLLKKNVDDVTSKSKDKPKSNRDSEAPSNITKNVIELFESKMLEEEEAVESEAHRKTTADGSSLDSIQKFFTFKNKYLGKDEDDDKIELHKNLSKSKTIEEKLNLMDSDLDYSDKLDEYESFYEDVANEVENGHEKANEASPSEKKQATEDTDIQKMRNDLIIGKVAGEDLLDSGNNVIIPKGKVLDVEDIMLAEKEAKLPELIINMTLQQ